MQYVLSTNPALTDRSVQVGNICVQWAHIEYLVALTIWSFLRLDHETGKIVTGGLDMLPRLNMAVALGRRLKAPPPVIKRLEAVRAAIQKDLGERRNRAVHGVRFPNPADPRSEFLEMHRGKSVRGRMIVTNVDLADVGKELSALSLELHADLTAFNVLQTVGVVPARIIAPYIARNTSTTTTPSESSPGT